MTPSDIIARIAGIISQHDAPEAAAEAIVEALGRKPLLWTLDHKGDWWAWPYRIRRIEGYYIVSGWQCGSNPYRTEEDAQAAAQDHARAEWWRNSGLGVE